FKLERLIGGTMPLLADDPCVHFLGHMSERRNLTDSVKVLQWCDRPRLCNRRHRRPPLTYNTLTQIMLHRNNSVGTKESLVWTRRYKVLVSVFATRVTRPLRVLQCARPSLANRSRARGCPNRSFAGAEWRWIFNPPCLGSLLRALTCCCSH